ncbi:Pyridoxal phosphate homeostasis protein [Symmachiella dynata]|uniref:Pyridoxal phosphate homeostasis protein n=1 Tax=Symmachiella dynata TaxID=2527995 RepID=A0A517ZNG1_9PLAN|nr:YggS family pyridoxal phosphate-dependent enzyme [Symmachiella dynata]QDU44022.1 Pyridoxal phosphate homeostasis protein [Symmachiella dynata]
MTTTSETIHRNYESVQQQIADACARVGRESSSVTLIAVVKYAQWEWVQALVAMGVTELGESRPQQLIQRSPLLGDEVCWHFIGHLQRNKIRKTLPVAGLIHSIDSLKLLRAVDRVAEELNLTSRVLLQVNVSGEATKGGFAPEELRASWDAVAECRHVEVSGLMTMAPESRDPGEARATFAGLRNLRDELIAAHEGLALPELSMGMSGDLEIAIEEGATMVRIGSRLFEGLEK